jgi:hypothetical protein
MAVTKKDELSVRVRTLVDAYAIGVRSGVLTPCLDDENWFRKLFGLSNAPAEVVNAWQQIGGVKNPITLQKSIPESTEPDQDQQTPQQPAQEVQE